MHKSSTDLCTDCGRGATVRSAPCAHGASGAARTNPNRLVIIETFDTREYAEQVFTSDTTHKAMTADGVDLASLAVEYLDEAV